MYSDNAVAANKLPVAAAAAAVRTGRACTGSHSPAEAVVIEVGAAVAGIADRGHTEHLWVWESWTESTQLGRYSRPQGIAAEGADSSTVAAEWEGR